MESPSQTEECLLSKEDRERRSPSKESSLDGDLYKGIEITLYTLSELNHRYFGSKSNRIRVATFIIVFLLFGMVSFHFIEGWNYFDCLYFIIMCIFYAARKTSYKTLLLQRADI